MFPFGFSFEELFILGAIVIVAGGYPEHFTRYARNGGVFVGRAVGFIRQKRDQVFASSQQKAEMQSMQSQLAEAMSQLQYIRHDIRYSHRPSPTPSSSLPTAEAINAHSLRKQMDDHTQQSPNQRPSASAEAGHAVPFDVAAPLTPEGTHTASERCAAQQRFRGITPESASGRTVYVAGKPLIPVSAAAAGRLPERRNANVTGSHIAEEALLEQEVAAQASQVLGMHVQD